MKLELGGPVVAELRHGTVRWEVLHLAAEKRPFWRLKAKRSARGGRYLGEHTVPLTWPSLCGLEGFLYAYGGPIRQACWDGHLQVCSVCRERCNRDHRGVAVSWKPRPTAASRLTLAA